MKFNLTTLALASALILAGCASKEPMDYLPESNNYLSIDLEQLRKEAGAKRAQEIMQKLSPDSKLDNEKATHIYAGIDAGPSGRFCCIMTGQSGLSDLAMAQLKKSGATDTKIDGMSAVTVKGMAAAPLSDSAMFFFAPADALVKMRNTSKKKNPAAADSALFKTLKTTSLSHAVGIAVNTKPIMGMADQALGAMSMMNPKGVEAAKTMESIVMTLDWDQQPEAAGIIALPGEDARKDLAGFLDTLKKMAGTQAGVVGQAGSLLADMKITPGTDGVDFELKIPGEAATAWLDGLDKIVANLPADPQARAMAMHKAFMQQQ